MNNYVGKQSEPHIDNYTFPTEELLNEAKNMSTEHQRQNSKQVSFKKNNVLSQYDFNSNLQMRMYTPHNYNM